MEWTGKGRVGGKDKESGKWTWNGLGTALLEWIGDYLKGTGTVLPGIDWEILYLEWTGKYSTWNGLGSALPRMD